MYLPPGFKAGDEKFETHKEFATRFDLIEFSVMRLSSLFVPKPIAV
jgi:hypothetical protein